MPRGDRPVDAHSGSPSRRYRGPLPVGGTPTHGAGASGLALTPIDQLLDLRHESLHHPRPHRLGQRSSARIPDRHVPGDRLRITPVSCAADWAVPVRSNASKSPLSPSRLDHESLRTPTGKANHLKPSPHRRATSITKRREPAENTSSHTDHQWPQARRNDGRNLELTGHTTAFFVAASTGAPARDRHAHG